jgi:1-deoxy-D-xylulose 5-phosphate reductoisomerase
VKSLYHRVRLQIELGRIALTKKTLQKPCDKFVWPAFGSLGLINSSYSMRSMYAGKLFLILNKESLVLEVRMLL